MVKDGMSSELVFEEFNEIHKEMTSLFSCGNAYIDSFLHSNKPLDFNIGKTYVLTNSTDIIGFFTLTANCFAMETVNGKLISQGGSIHILEFAIDEKYQDLTLDNFMQMPANILMSKCIDLIKDIQQHYIGCAFITLCATEDGEPLYTRFGFERMEEDFDFIVTDEEKTSIKMYHMIEEE